MHTLQWFLESHPLFTITLAAAALVLAGLTMVLMLILNSRVDHKLSVLLRKTSAQPEQGRFEQAFQEVDRTQKALDEMTTLVRETRAQGDAIHHEVNELVKVLADSRVEEIVRSEQEDGVEKLALRRLYETSRAELAPFTSSLSAVTPFVTSLSTYPTRNNAGLTALVRSLIQSYQQMQIVDSDLGSKIARLSDPGPSAAVAIVDARSRFDSGALTTGAYLRQVMATRPVEKLVLPAPDAESARYHDLAGHTTDTYLDWLDRINELRDLAIETGTSEISSACTQIIRQSRSVLEPLNVELDDVEIGRTQYDSRLHDLLHTIPRPGTRPETIIGIRKLGYRRNGATVRKPQVVVAAAGN